MVPPIRPPAVFGETKSQRLVKCPLSVLLAHASGRLQTMPTSSSASQPFSYQLSSQASWQLSSSQPSGLPPKFVTTTQGTNYCVARVRTTREIEQRFSVVSSAICISTLRMPRPFPVARTGTASRDAMSSTRTKTRSTRFLGFFHVATARRRARRRGGCGPTSIDIGDATCVTNPHFVPPSPPSRASPCGCARSRHRPRIPQKNTVFSEPY